MNSIRKIIIYRACSYTCCYWILTKISQGRDCHFHFTGEGVNIKERAQGHAAGIHPLGHWAPNSMFILSKGRCFSGENTKSSTTPSSWGPGEHSRFYLPAPTHEELAVRDPGRTVPCSPWCCLQPKKIISNCGDEMLPWTERGDRRRVRSPGSHTIPMSMSSQKFCWRPAGHWIILSRDTLLKILRRILQALWRHFINEEIEA